MFRSEPFVLVEDDWQVHTVLFARAGFTEATRAAAEELGVQLVDLETLDRDLRKRNQRASF